MKRSSIPFALVALLAAACGRQASRAPETPGEAEPKAVEALSALGYVAQRQDRAAAGPMPVAAPAAMAPSPVPRLPASLKLIRTAALVVEVPDFRAAVEQATRAVASLGGYVSDRQSSEDGAGRERGQVTLRVPSGKFDGALSALKTLGRVTSEGVQTQDVTRAYADLETRLAVKREAAARLREILRRQTGKVSEVLEVEREIARVVEDIEQAEGERRYLEHQVSLSAITLSLHEPDALVHPGFLDPVLAALRQSLRILGESLGSMIELLAGLLPWLAAVYLSFRLVRWRLRRRG
jgi:Domain of unknown function (DUF4349)